MNFLRFVHIVAMRWTSEIKVSIKLSLLVQFLFQANKPASHKHSLTFRADCKASSHNEATYAKPKCLHRDMGVAK